MTSGRDCVIVYEIERGGIKWLMKRRSITVISHTGDYGTPNNVSSPSHYTSGNIEVIDAIEDWGLHKDHYLACVVKYIARAGKKNHDTFIEDLRKAQWYLDRRIGCDNE